MPKEMLSQLLGKSVFHLPGFFHTFGLLYTAKMPTTPLDKSKTQTNTFEFSQVCVNDLGIQLMFLFFHINFIYA